MQTAVLKAPGEIQTGSRFSNPATTALTPQSPVALGGSPAAKAVVNIKSNHVKWR